MAKPTDGGGVSGTGQQEAVPGPDAVAPVILPERCDDLGLCGVDGIGGRVLASAGADAAGTQPSERRFARVQAEIPVPPGVARELLLQPR
jgi:hypothetical protein